MKNAVMNISQGETIVTSMRSGHITGTGVYRLIAKKKKDGTIEWAHFTKRDNGIRENVYRGEVKDFEEMNLVISIMNKHLVRVFGEDAKMVDDVTN